MCKYTICIFIQITFYLGQRDAKNTCHRQKGEI